MKSIDINGVIQPAIAFINENNQIELISGHRRHRASELLGRETLPVIIKQMTRDEAIIAMGETNLQSRDEILPSEKAYTYKAMYEAMKRQGKRSDLTSGPVDQKLNSRQLLAEKVNDSEKQIQRYIRLTNLIPELLELVDSKRIGLRPAVEMSYFPVNLQTCIYGIYETEEITPSHAQTIKMKKLHKENLLDEKEINKILMEEKPNQKDKFKLSETIVNKYFSDCLTRVEIENKIIRALKLLEKQEHIIGKQNVADDEMDISL